MSSYPTGHYCVDCYRHGRLDEVTCAACDNCTWVTDASGKGKCMPRYSSYYHYPRYYFYPNKFYSYPYIPFDYYRKHYYPCYRLGRAIARGNCA